jgi:hypothetical protein
MSGDKQEILARHPAEHVGVELADHADSPQRIEPSVELGERLLAHSERPNIRIASDG